MQSNHIRRLMPFIMLLSAVAILCATSCREAGRTSDTIDYGNRSVLRTDTSYFHADNDIAMMIRSLADALRVGEPLDSTQYDFEGVLTDGQGTPLYTDVMGSPGTWQVDVLDVRNAIIRNIYLGDLLPLDLQNYILQSLDVPLPVELEYNGVEALEDDETDISVFDCHGVYLRFEVRAGVAPNGIEGPQLSIIMSSEPPTAAERRKDA